MTNPHHEIERLIQRIEDGFNGNDAATMTDAFIEDASAGDAIGHVLTGRNAIVAAAREALAGFLSTLYVRYTVDSVDLVADDVAVVRKSAVDVDVDGEPTGKPGMRSLYVMVRTPQGWQIAARQNTVIADLGS